MQLLQAPPISVVLLPTEKKAIRVIADTSRSGWCNTRDFVKTISGAYRRRNVRAAWSSSTTDSAAATETASLRAVRDVSTTTLIRVITKVRVDFVIVHERLSLLHNFSPSLSLSLSRSRSPRAEQVNHHGSKRNQSKWCHLERTPQGHSCCSTCEHWSFGNRSACEVRRSKRDWASFSTAAR